MLYFANFALFWVFFPIFLVILLYKLFFYKYTLYLYPLADEIDKNCSAQSNISRTILLLIRSLLLLLLLFLILRPQFEDKKSSVTFDGIDIILDLDVSGSMDCFDDLRDRRSRLEVAKIEAANFIKKRPADSIGLVIFGKDAVSRCPLTLDKNILLQSVADLKIGIVDPDGTALCSSIICAVNRLKDSKAKSKILVLLTDGVPARDEISPEIAIDVAKKFGIKIYSIGIGREDGGFCIQNGFAYQRNDLIDMDLLTKISNQTGGAAFRAHNAKELSEIYNKIDQLEKTKVDVDLFYNYYDAFYFFVWFLILVLLLELVLRFFIFRGV